MGLAAFAFGLFLFALGLIAFAVWRIFAHKSPLERMAKRGDPSAATATRVGASAIMAGERGQAPGGRGRLLGFLEKRLRAAGINMPTERFGAFMLGATVGIAVLFPLLANLTGLIHSIAAYLLIILFAVAIGIGAPLAWLSRRATKRLAEFESQFPGALDIFVRGLRAGHPVSSALELLITEMPDPIAREFGLVGAEMNYGLDLRAALSNLAGRVNTPDINMFVVSVAIQSETGGNLADILEGLARVIRERASMVMKVRALSSEGRMTATLLSILPVGAFSFIFATQPRFYLNVADDPIFLPGFAFIFCLYGLGMFVMNRLVQIKV